MAGSGWVEECLEVVKSNLGDGFEGLCDVKPSDIKLFKEPVVGWLVITFSVDDKRTDEGDSVHVQPLVLVSTVEGRDAYVDVTMGYQAMRDELDGLEHVHKLEMGDRVVGVLPSWPNTYYVIGYVKNVAFSLGVHINPDDEVLTELLLRAYLSWLRSYETRNLKHKLVKLATRKET